LDGHQYRIACREGIQREEVKRRRAVEEHVLIIAAKGLQESAQTELAIFHCHELYGGASQVLVGRDQIETIYLGLLNQASARLFENQAVIKRAAGWVLGKAKGSRAVRLGIAVNDQSSAFRRRQRRSEIDDRCGLSDAPLLIGNCDYATQSSLSTVAM
jgi:hypothetical protein